MYKQTQSKIGFTLAEVLITLGVIGVVAAITIPTLVTNIQAKVKERQIQVTKARFIEGLNLLNIRDNGFSVEYNNTEEFVRALSKHMKLVSICGKDNLQNCFPYSDINYDANGKIKQTKISSLTSASKMKLKGDDWLEPASFITASGIPYIVTFNKKCSALTEKDSQKTIVDPDRPFKDIPQQCIDGVYDYNGAQGPNKYQKDVITWGDAKIGSECVDEIGNVCITTAAFTPTPITQSECNSLKTSLGIKRCPVSTDYWAGAVKQCGGIANIPTEEELRDLSRILYNNNAIEIYWAQQNMSIDTSKIPNSLTGIGSTYQYIWADYEETSGEYRAGYRSYKDFTNYGRYTRSCDYIKAICVKRS